MPFAIPASVFPFNVIVVVTSNWADSFLSKLAIRGLIVLLPGVVSLTVIASVCVAPPLNVNVKFVVPTT
ncbi:hypothetical protein D3C73_787590 [compost metagenome]